MTAEHAAGRLEALRRCAEEGATHGWSTVPPLVDLLLAIVRSDRRQPTAAADRAEFLDGWAAGVLETAGHVLADPDELANRVRAAVLAAETAVVS